MQQPILLIRNIYLNAFGGAETYQIALAKELQKLGRTPLIVTSSKPLRLAAKKQGIKAVRGCYLPHQNWSGYRNLFLPLYFFWQLILFLWYLFTIARFRPRALHIQNRDDMIAGTIAGKLTGTRVIWTDHADLRKLIWENLDQKYKNPIGKLIFKLAKLPYKITTVSDHEYRAINHLISPRTLPNLIVVKNGVPDHAAAYLKNLKDSNNLDKPQSQSLCYLGRIVADKGIKELLDAFALVAPKFPAAKLEIYGDGPDLPLFKAYVNNFEKSIANRITFRGHTSKPLTAMSKSKIFVLASYHEGLSLSLLDAAMLKRAIVATSVDGNPEIVMDKKTGLLVPPKDKKSLARALETLLKNPTLAEKYATAARKLYEQDFDFSKIVKVKMEPLYYEKS